MSSSMCAALKISLITFASDLLSGVGSRTRWTGHSAGMLNHDGPSFHNVFPETFPPRLPMSTEFSAVGTWCQITFSWWRICCTLLYSELKTWNGQVPLRYPWLRTYQSLGNFILLFDYCIDNCTNAVWARISESMQGDLLNWLMVRGYIRTEALYRTRAFRSIPYISFVVGLRPMEFYCHTHSNKQVFQSVWLVKPSPGGRRFVPILTRCFS
jgi:hypothetical protein